MNRKSVKELIALTMRGCTCPDDWKRLGDTCDACRAKDMLKVISVEGDRGPGG